MSHRTMLGLSLVVAGLLTWSSGCNNEDTTTAPPATTTEEPAAETASDLPPPEPQGEPATLPTEGNPAAEPGVEGTGAAPADEDAAMAAEIEASLASLSAEDRELAREQKICPVGGGPLGAMGTPTKVTVAGHEVLVCCEGCEEPLKNDPDKYLAKIGLEPADDEAVQ